MNNNPRKSPLLVTILMATATLILSGCDGDRKQLASDKMEAIKKEPAQEVEPIPQPQLVRDYIYDSTDIRSPFLPSSLLNRQEEVENTDGVRPDVNRKKEPLEKFELSQLTYRGLVVSPSGEQYGLIQRPDGLVDSVRVGNYMGLNDGRVVEITSTQINLVEIVPDNRAGYVEQPAAIISP